MVCLAEAAVDHDQPSVGLDRAFLPQSPSPLAVAHYVQTEGQPESSEFSHMTASD